MLERLAVRFLHGEERDAHARGLGGLGEPSHPSDTGLCLERRRLARDGKLHGEHLVLLQEKVALEKGASGGEVRGFEDELT